ncbi:MAG TPA: hypothetical protein VKA67_07945, partial [Verrucomicrobiae bacterium]|nr:hypothetical protein [Verrucomicrobiae bacterium]
MKRFLIWTCGAVLLLAAVSECARAAANTAGSRFSFRLPQAVAYHVDENQPALRSATVKPKWLKAYPESGATNFVELGSRIVVRFKPEADLKRLIAGHPLKMMRKVTSDVFILQAPDALTAAEEAQRLAALPEVSASYPVMRRQVALNGLYAPKPNDMYYYYQWYFENRGSDGTRLGADIDLRSAWPYTQGSGVTVAVADGGFETDHPELAAAA